MHILFISEYYPPVIMGGGEINLATLAQALADHNQTNPNTENIKVSILTSPSPNLSEIEIHPNITIYRRLNTGSSPSSFLGNLSRFLLLKRSIIKQTKKIIEQQNHPIDIIHFIGGTIIAAKKLKQHLKKSNQHLPLFATIESYPALCPKGDRWYKQKQPCTVKCTLSNFLTCQSHCTEIGKMKNAWYLKYNPLFLLVTYQYYYQRNQALQHCHLIAISKYVQNLLQQQNLQSTIIPNILDIAPFKQANQKSSSSLTTQPSNHRTASSPNYPTATPPLRLLYLGSLIKSKGPHILLQALKEINPNTYHLNLYGNGIMKPQLQTYITTNNLNAAIHPPVLYEQIPALYANANLILFPSIWPEPFGRIPIEAHAANKIVIASNIGAIPELTTSSDILFTPGNSTELHQIITQQITLFKKKNIPQQSLEQWLPKTITTAILKQYKESTIRKV